LKKTKDTSLKKDVPTSSSSGAATTSLKKEKKTFKHVVVVDWHNTSLKKGTQCPGNPDVAGRSPHHLMGWLPGQV
jgi:hypothetical protein